MEQLVEKLINSFPAGAFILKNGKISVANDKFCKLLNYSNNEITGLDWNEIIDDDFAKEFPLKSLVYERKTIPIKMKLRSGNYLTRDVEFEKLNVDTQVLWLGKCNHHQISLQNILRSMDHVPVKAINPKGEIIFWNSACEKLFGYEKEEVLGKRIEEILVPEHLKKQIKENIKSWLNNNFKLHSTKQNWINSDNDDLKLISNFIPIENFDGKKCIYCINIDSRDLDELGQHFWQIQRLKSIGNLASGVAEIFNNILSVIMGRAQMAMTKIDQQQDGFKNLDTILKAAKSAKELTRKLLIFSRNEAMPLRILDLNDTIANFLKMSGNKIEDNLEIKQNLAPDLWKIRGNRSYIEKAIMNLLINSQESSPNNVKVVVKTENVVLREEQDSSNKFTTSGHYVRISIKDNGSGISNNIIDKIFDPFFTTKNKALHNGLGLSVVYGIIKNHRGWIDVHSSPQQGTRIIIDIPAVNKD